MGAGVGISVVLVAEEAAVAAAAAAAALLLEEPLRQEEAGTTEVRLKYASMLLILRTLSAVGGP